MEITKEMRERLIARLNRKMLEHKALYLLCNSRFEGGARNEHWLIREISRLPRSSISIFRDRSEHVCQR